MSRNTFKPSFYRWAMNLPAPLDRAQDGMSSPNPAESAPVVSMHRLAREIFAELGGDAVQRHIAFYEAILLRWHGETGKHIGDREAMRAMGCIERGHAKVAALRETAWLQARAEVFQHTGERIPLPLTPEDADHAQDAEEAALVRQLSQQLRHVGALAKEMGKGSGTFSAQRPVPAEIAPAAGAEPAASTGSGQAVAESQEPLTNREVKEALRRLADAGHGKAVCETLRHEARSGKLTRGEFAATVEKLLGAA